MWFWLDAKKKNIVQINESILIGLEMETSRLAKDELNKKYYNKAKKNIFFQIKSIHVYACKICDLPFRAPLFQQILKKFCIFLLMIFIDDDFILKILIVLCNLNQKNLRNILHEMKANDYQ